MQGEPKSLVSERCRSVPMGPDSCACHKTPGATTSEVVRLRAPRAGAAAGGLLLHGVRTSSVGTMATFSVPISLISDSYKASHWLQYPDCTKMVAVRPFSMHATYSRIH